MSRWITFFALMLVTVFSLAQSRTDTTVLLEPIIVYDDLLRNSEIGLAKIPIDSMALAQTNGNNISDLLRRNAGGQIRSYGPSGLTSPSFRGTGGSHTAVLWNGINLQSGLSGSTDLSQLPVSFVDEVSLQKGGTSSLYGSGAIGGTIQLNNQSRFNQGISAHAQQRLGSFGNYYGGYGLKYSNLNFTNTTQVFHRKIDNNYPYTNNYNNPPTEELRQNAASKQWGIIQQNDWRINDNHLIGIKLWYQDNQLEVPSPIVGGDNNAGLQNDEFIRAMLDWNYDIGDLTFIYKQALIWHNLTFVPASLEPSVSQLSTWVNRVEVDYKFSNRYSLVTGINHNYDKASVDNFGGQPSRNTTALFSSLKTNWLDQRLLMAFSFRQELIDGSLAPFSPTIGIESELFDGFWLKGSISKNYRQPTFNDLYWFGDGARGNSELLAETSFNYEGGFQFTAIPKSHPYNLSTQITAYNYLVDNWVQWQLADGIWSPVNLKQVRSKGIETQITGNLNYKAFKSSLDLIYNYTQSINEALNDGSNSATLGKQLTYTPVHEASINWQIEYSRWQFTVNHVITGKQYTEAENRDRFAINAYQITDFYFNYSLKVNKVNLAFQGEINNAFDTQYENRRGYPMYGRNYSIGLTITFRNKN